MKRKFVAIAAIIQTVMMSLVWLYSLFIVTAFGIVHLMHLTPRSFNTDTFFILVILFAFTFTLFIFVQFIFVIKLIKIKTAPKEELKKRIGISLILNSISAAIVFPILTYFAIITKSFMSIGLAITPLLLVVLMLSIISVALKDDYSN